MTVLVERALHATGMLADFNNAGVLSLADVHIARRVVSAVGGTSSALGNIGATPTAACKRELHDR